MSTNGFEALGDVLAGGTAPMAQQAFMKGQLDQANVGHLSATTQEALAQAQLTQMNAKKAQDEYENRQNLADALLKSNPDMTPEQAQAGAVIIRSGAATFPTLAQGEGAFQTQHFRSTLGDPNADPNVRLAASSAIQGKLQSPFVQVPQESVNVAAPGVAGATPAVHESPLGDAMIASHNATTTKTLLDAANPGRADKAPVGYAWVDPNDHSKGVTPLAGGPHDPNAPQNPGVRGAQYALNVLNAVHQTDAELHNIVQLPIGVDAGILGIGANPGTGLFSTPFRGLKNAMTSQDVQMYNASIAGIQSQLATIDKSGMVPTEALIKSFNRYVYEPGDTQITKLYKLAGMRQTMEEGLKGFLNSNRVPDAQKDEARSVLASMKQSVPFTRDDVLAYQKQGNANPQLTFQDFIKQKHLGNATGTSGTPTDGTLPLTNAQGWVLHQDANGNKAYVSPDGKQYEAVQ